MKWKTFNTIVYFCIHYSQRFRRIPLWRLRRHIFLLPAPSATAFTAVNSPMTPSAPSKLSRAISLKIRKYAEKCTCWISFIQHNIFYSSKLKCKIQERKIAQVNLMLVRKAVLIFGRYQGFFWWYQYVNGSGGMELLSIWEENMRIFQIWQPRSQYLPHAQI